MVATWVCVDQRRGIWWGRQPNCERILIWWGIWRAWSSGPSGVSRTHHWSDSCLFLPLPLLLQQPVNIKKKADEIVFTKKVKINETHIFTFDSFQNWIVGRVSE